MRKSPTALKTIAEVSELLSLPKTVLRFWEKAFDHIKPMKLNNIRYYSPDDIKKLEEVKHFLYVKNYTINKTKFILDEAKKLDNIKNIKKILKALYAMKGEL
jgi:DNA-binding transcriptional MerR regulator